MPREQLQARCDPDTIDEVQQLADEKGISKSEAVRRLIRTGIEAKADEADDDEPETRRAGQTATLLMILVVALLTFVLTALNTIGGAI
jgi:hypothetical protein